MKNQSKNSRYKSLRSTLNKLTWEEYDLVKKIVDRMNKIGEKVSGYVLRPESVRNAELTIISTHGLFNLMLKDFLEADEFNFIMEFRDIDTNLNRETGEMENGFIPRFSIGGK